ncbi:TIGR00282 family metallophosphoesterase [Patescibacteria group bacterium]|nr:TIGR00282 family metallophosphoesterase [Patescibacteria group bacterium]
MKILFIGDIVGKSGRWTVEEFLPKMKETHRPDLVIANAENLSHGNGFSPKGIAEMRRAGVNFFTTGDHAWGNRDGMNELGKKDFPVIRPANFPNEKTPGNGYEIFQTDLLDKVLVINLIGRVFMKKHYDCPFKAVDKILQETANEDLAAIFVDFHAEATSEKYAMGFYLDGRVSAVIGTHTHVPTADLRILEGGTAFMADVGMTGSLDSVIGVNKDIIINSFLTQLPVKHQIETNGQMVFNAVIVEIDDKTQKALTVSHLQEIF